MTGIRKKNKILGFIFAVLAVWMVIFQNPSYAAQRGSLNIKTEQTGMMLENEAARTMLMLDVA